MLNHGIANQLSPAGSSPVFVQFSFYTLHNEIFLAQDFCETVQAGVVIFYMQDDNDILYCGIENQTSAAYFSQHLSNFLSFHTLHNEIFCQRLL